MLIIHAVQKLLNVSRLKAPLHVSQPSEGQLMHSWYAALVPTGQPGKLLVMYVHEPSMMVVLCRGKTLRSTWPLFRDQVVALMRRFRFPEQVITRESAWMEEGFVVSKTSSRSMLGIINHLQLELNYWLYDCALPYPQLPLALWEDRLMDRLYATGPKKHDYQTAERYWQQLLALEY